MKKSIISALTLLPLLSSCSKDDPKVINTVEFGTDQLTITERSTERIELTFSESTEATDSFIITVTNSGASAGDYVLSESVVNNEFIITKEEPFFYLTAVFDTLSETNETVLLEVTPESDGYKVGEKSTMTITLKNYNLGNNLVGEYLFSGDANDSSPGNSNHGTVFQAGLTSDRTNNINSAYNFDGVNDFITIPDNSATDFNSTQNFSISLWVAPAAVQADLSSSINYILRKWAGDSQPYPYAVSILNSTHPNFPNEFYFEIWDGAACGDGANGHTGVITFDGYKHFVMVKNGDVITQYLNGVKISEVTSSLNCEISNETDITIGTGSLFIRYFKGKIDDIRFYNAAIDQNLVTELFEEEPIN